MDTLSVATIALAAVTFMLALVAVYSIWQTYQIRKKDIEITHKLALLDELDDCAKECTEKIGQFNWNQIYEDMSAIENLNRESALLEYETELTKKANETLRAMNQIKDKDKLEFKWLNNQHNELSKKMHDVRLIQLKDLPATSEKDRKARYAFHWAEALYQNAVRFDEGAKRLTIIGIQQMDSMKITQGQMKKTKDNLNELYSKLMSDKMPEGEEISELVNNIVKDLYVLRSMLYHSKLEILSNSMNL